MNRWIRQRREVAMHILDNMQIKKGCMENEFRTSFFALYFIQREILNGDISLKHHIGSFQEYCRK